MTREEIVAALRCCANGSGCDTCPRQDVPEAIEDCGDGLMIAAADLIENQQREMEALRQANEGLRYNLAALHGSGVHPDPVGKKGQMAECPVCGGMCGWAPETDVSSCRVCGYTNGKAQRSIGGGVSDTPRWCADCRYFEACGPSGEGECKAPKPKVYVWYGRVACENFQEVSP